MAFMRALLGLWLLVGFVLSFVALGLSVRDRDERGSSVLAARLLCCITWPLALLTQTGRAALTSMFRKAPKD